MSPQKPDPEAWGIEPRYKDTAKVWHEAPVETIDKILEAMGADAEAPAGQGEASPVMVIERGVQGSTSRGPAVGGHWTITHEDGSVRHGSGELPDDLPFGYHDLHRDDGTTLRLIVAPDACPSLEDLNAWGWSLQLYSLRSSRSWGIGDLGDLADFADLAKSGGAGLVIVNPLHAALPGLPQQASPYYPSSREFRNPLYLRIEDVPGVEKVDVSALATAAHELNTEKLIDRDMVWTLKQQALEMIWPVAQLGDEFETYVAGQGDPLARYATFCAISEVYGHPWNKWPEEFQHPNNAAVREFAEEHQDRLRFHAWQQWLLEEQLREAGSKITLVQDLAVGVDPAGADGWLWQDLLALNVRVGAPPDRFNTLGQDWGLPPLDPWRLKELCYEPFVRIVRACLRHSGGLRIDHVMGLFRLYWIPDGVRAPEGTYVQYQWEDLLAIVALECHRIGAHAVGEDLGTVQTFMREELKKRNVMSYKLVWFQTDRPSDFDRGALAAVTTHDLPTIVGLMSGADLALQESMGTQPNVAATTVMRDRVRDWIASPPIDLPPEASLEDTVIAVHALEAEAPCVWVTASLDDALCVAERPNYPGTTVEWPNWSVALPSLLDDLTNHRAFNKIASVLTAGQTRNQKTSPERL